MRKIFNDLSYIKMENLERAGKKLIDYEKQLVESEKRALST